MRMLMAMMFLLLSAQSWSVTIYSCDVTALEKRPAFGEATPWTKKIFLSSEFTNRVDFHSTVLDLTLDHKGGIQGSVNGQPNFNLEGNVKSGFFESAKHKGSIICDKGQKVSHLFQHKPWKQFFSLNSNLSEGQILTKIETNDLKYKLICFIGDVKAAEADASAVLKIKGTVKSPYEISFTWTDTVCARGRGSNVDDYVCEEARKEERTEALRHCYLSGNERP